MAEGSEKPGQESFPFFSLADNNRSQLGFGTLDFAEKPLPPPPPCVEVLFSEKSSSVKYTVESVNLDGGLTLLKGRVSTSEVFSFSDSDLVPGKYEGGLKLWEGSLDLIKTLHSELENRHLSIMGKRVLELGCGHGLPGIFTCLEDAAVVHFQDFNAEVLQCLTIPNVIANLPKISHQPLATKQNEKNSLAELRFFAGDWHEIHRLFPYAYHDEKASDNGLEQELEASDNRLEQELGTGYDIILMAETVYSVDSLQNLYGLIKKCISHPHGVVYMAAKKYYFGVGGGSRRFVSVVEKDGIMAASLIAEVADGSSNVREVWKFSLR